MNAFKYRPDIDGLRAVAVSLVLLFHGGLGVPGGFVGVDVFFVISGYLITGLILSQQQAGTFTLRSFYARRIRRIVPACALMVAVCLVCGFVLLFPPDYDELARSAASQTLMASNILFWKTIDYFNSAADLKPLLHTWSLAVEEQFYLVYPFMLVVLARFSRRTAAWILGCLCLGSLALSEWGARTHPDPTFYLLPTRAWELWLGGLLCYLPGSQTLRLGPRGNQLLSLTGASLILVAAFWLESGGRFPGFAALLPCGGAALLIASNTHGLTLVGRALASKPMVGLGLISYSLYLWHWPLLAFARYWNVYELPRTVRGLILVVSLAVAWLSWRYVETPLRRVNSFKHPRWVLTGIMATAPLLLLGSSAVMLRHGFPERFSSQVLEHLAVKEQEKGKYRAELTVARVQNGAVPSFGVENGRLKCLVWGDSHAMSLVPGVEEACHARKVQGFQITHSATPPLLDFINRQVFGLNDASPAFNRAVVDFARANGVELVILGGAWPDYVKDSTFETQLQSTVDELCATGIRVAIVLDVAWQDVDVPLELAHNVWLGLPTSTVGVPIEKQRAKNALCDPIINRVARGKATVLDPAPYFVQESGIWPAEIDGKALYFDYHHLSKTGSLRLQDLFEELFDSVAQHHTSGSE